VTPQAPFDSQDYWINRHQKFVGSHQATGLLGSSERANRVLYDLRRRALEASLNGSDLTGARVLDAGCGRGDFSRFYSERGAQVYGCDVSSLAVEYCRQHRAGNFECGRITDVPRLFPGVQFDVIHSFDVLYHLVDDREWQDSLAVMDDVSVPTAPWYLTEIVWPRSEAPHMRLRRRSGYARQLARHGRAIVAERRLHWLLSVRPELHARFPGLSVRLEPLCQVPLAAWMARVGLWTIRRVPQGGGEAAP
jgi:SAM-dependent methyltransferase